MTQKPHRHREENDMNDTATKVVNDETTAGRLASAIASEGIAFHMAPQPGGQYRFTVAAEFSRRLIKLAADAEQQEGKLAQMAEAIKDAKHAEQAQAFVNELAEGNSAPPRQPRQFAKLFDSAKIGQILATLEAGEEGPEIIFSWYSEATSGVAKFRMGYKDATNTEDEAWDKAGKIFGSIKPEDVCKHVEDIEDKIRQQVTKATTRLLRGGKP